MGRRATGYRELHVLHRRFRGFPGNRRSSTGRASVPLASMPPFIYFLVLLSVSLAAVTGLRLALIRTGRQIQKHVGFSDRALTHIAVTFH